MESPNIFNLIALMQIISMDKIEQNCFNCGADYATIIREKRFQCPECYSSFQSIARKILQLCQSDTKHVGKIPPNWQERKAKYQEEREALLDKREKISNLKAKMKKAIDIENYEIAAILKKKIEEIN